MVHGEVQCLSSWKCFWVQISGWLSLPRLVLVTLYQSFSIFCWCSQLCSCIWLRPCTHVASLPYLLCWFLCCLQWKSQWKVRGLVNRIDKSHKLYSLQNIKFKTMKIVCIVDSASFSWSNLQWDFRETLGALRPHYLMPDVRCGSSVRRWEVFLLKCCACLSLV